MAFPPKRQPAPFEPYQPGKPAPMGPKSKPKPKRR